MNPLLRTRIGFFPVLILFLVIEISGQAQPKSLEGFSESSFRGNKAIDLDKLGWKFTTSDSSQYANQDFDDQAWITLADSSNHLDSITKWEGIGWFRLRFGAAQDLAQSALILEMAHLGASEVYFNGRLVARNGVIGEPVKAESGQNPNARPISLIIEKPGEQVLAIRYSNRAATQAFFSRWLNSFGETPPGINGPGFRSRLAKVDASDGESRIGYGSWAFSLTYIAAETFAYFSFGILHLLLFAFFSRHRNNLFFGVALVFFGLNDVIFSNLLTGHFGMNGWYLLWWGLTLTWFPAILSLLAFVYVTFAEVIPSRFWYFVAGTAFVALWEHVWPVKYWSPISTLCTFLIILEMLRVMFLASRRGIRGSGFVIAGIVLLSVNLVQGTLPTPILPFAVGTFGMILSVSLYLAREYARTNRDLEERLLQVQSLSAAAVEHEKVKAENERRAAELEEARQLQLSMLPRKVPQFPSLEIAAFMKTATEVGGDYYDFFVDEAGCLTIAVGDATGHGLKAGTMVTAVKSLFETLAYHPEIPHVFDRISRTIKKMNLRGLFMAMTMVKISEGRVVASIAGMPPIFVYRTSEGSVEELALRALPLGGVSGYKYRQEELVINAGDVLLVMSDGLPERFNQSGEMLDYEAVKKTFAEVAGKSPDEIIERLVALGDEWADGKAQDDDVTFVVVKGK